MDEAATEAGLEWDEQKPRKNEGGSCRHLEVNIINGKRYHARAVWRSVVSAGSAVTDLNLWRGKPSAIQKESFSSTTK